MSRQDTDQLYIELDYFSPEEYYTYEASAESALASEFSLAATISHIEGVDIVATSFASVDVAGNKIRTADITMSSEFGLSAQSSGTEEASATVTATVTLDIMISKISDATVTLSSEFAQTAQAERFINIDATIDSAATQVSDCEVIRGFGVGLSSDSDCSCVNYRVREDASEVGALFNVAIQIEITVNSFAILDSVSTVTADVDRVVGDVASLITSVFTVTATAAQIKSTAVIIASTAALSVTAKKLPRPYRQYQLTGGTPNDEFQLLSSGKWGTGYLGYNNVTAVPSAFNNFVWTGSEFVGFDNDYTWKSSNGETWTRYANNISVTPATNTIIYANSTFAYVGNVVSTNNLEIYYSTDGITWSVKNITNIVLGQVVRELRYLDGYWHFIHEDFSSPNYIVRNVRSTTINGTWAENISIYSVASNGGITTTPNTDNFHTHYSVSGSTGNSTRIYNGTSVSTPTVPTNTTLLYTNNSSQYVVKVGFSDPDWRYSTNTGSSYSTLSLPNNAEILSVQYLGGRWFVRSYSTIYSGTNITSLTACDIPVGTFASNKFVYGSSKWLTMYQGQSLISTDGVNFTAYNIAGTEGQNAKLSYTVQNGSTFSNFGTVDFWYYATGFDYGEIHFGTPELFSLNLSESFIEVLVNDNRTNISSALTANQWNHIRIAKSGTGLSIYSNGTRRFNGTASFTQTGLFLEGLMVLDELLVTDDLLTDPSLTSLTPPSGPYQNTANTKLLLHFDGTFEDDVSIIQLAQAALTASASITAVGSKTSDSEADLSSASNVTAEITVLIDSAASLTSQGFVVAAVARKVDELAVLSSESIVTAQATRRRNAESSISASSQVTASVTRIKSSSVAISSAMSASIAANKFEGFALLTLGSASSLTANANYTIRVVSTITSAAALSATGFEARKDSDYPLTGNALIKFNSSTGVDEYGGTVSTGYSFTSSGKFNGGGIATSTPTLLSNGTQFNGMFYKDSWTIDFWFKTYDLVESGSFILPERNIITFSSVDDNNPVTADLAIGYWINNYAERNGSTPASGEVYFWFGYVNTSLHWVNSFPIIETWGIDNYSTQWRHVAVTFKNLGANGSGGGYTLYDIESKIFVDGQGRTMPDAGPLALYHEGDNNIRILPFTYNIPNRNQVGSFDVSARGIIDDFRLRPSVVYVDNFTPPTSEATVQFNKQGYALLEPRFTVRLLVTQNAQATISSSSTVSVSGIRIRNSSSNLTLTSSVTANIGKVVGVSSSVSSSATLASSAQRFRSTASTIATDSTLSVSAQRVRFADSQQSATASLAAAADRTRTLESAITGEINITADDQRVRYFDTEFTSIATQLTAAGYNATGTVLLESRFESSVEVQKITDVVSNAVIDTEFTVLNDRFRSVDSQQTATATLGCDALNIRPAGSDMSVTASLSINTDNSRIVGITANSTSEFTQNTINDTLRFAVISVAAEFATAAIAYKVKQFDLALTSQASIEILTGIRADARADLPAISIQLAVGDVINIDPFYQIKVEQESRRGTVLPENRLIMVEQETRLNMII